jgi:hypothetical protein
MWIYKTYTTALHSGACYRVLYLCVSCCIDWFHNWVQEVDSVWHERHGSDFDCHLIRLVYFLSTGVGGLRNVAVIVPLAVSPGDTVTLQCSYDLEGDELYTVKWYKGRQEFFRYVPKELPHTRVFPLPGVNVDVSPNVCHSLLSLYSYRFTAL